MRSEKKRIYRKAKMQFGASAGILDLVRGLVATAK
jgi:hypothetical protein